MHVITLFRWFRFGRFVSLFRVLVHAKIRGCSARLSWVIILSEQTIIY